MKTKNVDVVVTNPIVGPVLAISCKGTTKSFRNLANRLEETIGECTNLHITYPAMVLGYFALLRANRTLQDALEAPADTADTAGDDKLLSSADTESGQRDIEPSGIKTKIIEANDIAITFGADGVETATEGIKRFHAALSEMTLRHGIRDEISRYEAMTIVLVEPRGQRPGSIFSGYPSPASPLHHERFFETLYQRYEERFIYGAPLLAERGITSRFEWAPESPALQNVELDFMPRRAGR